ncbi:YkyB family protein [Sporosarcina sp. USHLN248]|uniref:YkyB family protein n=1 Tax=Sporosarcina sp. USHLN248 TaxID=3081300 RepID=UPI003017C7B5
MKEEEVRKIAIAIYTINRHAKTAPDNKQLYMLKNMAIQKLIKTGNATKIGLHYIEQPKFSRQSSTVLVQCSDFLFHTLPEKEDFTSLPHLGDQNQSYRNPQERMGLQAAKTIVENFLGIHPPIKKSIKTATVKRKQQKQPQSFRSSYLDGR